MRRWGVGFEAPRMKTLGSFGRTGKRTSERFSALILALCLLTFFFVSPVEAEEPLEDHASPVDALLDSLQLLDKKIRGSRGCDQVEESLLHWAGERGEAVEAASEAIEGAMEAERLDQNELRKLELETERALESLVEATMTCAAHPGVNRALTTLYDGGALGALPTPQGEEP